MVLFGRISSWQAACRSCCMPRQPVYSNDRALNNICIWPNSQSHMVHFAWEEGAEVDEAVDEYWLAFGRQDAIQQVRLVKIDTPLNVTKRSYKGPACVAGR